MNRKIYVAGGWNEKDSVIRPYLDKLRQTGFEITHDWTTDIVVGTDADIPPLERVRRAQEDLAGVAAADFLWLVVPGYTGSRGSWVELGFAFGLRATFKQKVIVISGVERKKSIFADLADFSFDDHDAALEFIQTMAFIETGTGMV
jgi:hypothetical protein